MCEPPACVTSFIPDPYVFDTFDLFSYQSGILLVLKKRLLTLAPLQEGENKSVLEIFSLIHIFPLHYSVAVSLNIPMFLPITISNPNLNFTPYRKVSQGG